jgi:hypothetical protein
MLVSGTNGWYVSDNGAAFVGPIGVGGGGGGGNATGLTFGSQSIPLGITNLTSGQFLTFHGTNIVGGTPTTAQGVSSFNTRTGSVMPALGDYTVADISGAAALDSPSFSGIPRAPNPDAASNDTQIATTAWVKANAAGGGGGGGPALPITQTTACQAYVSATTYTLSGLNIQPNDTVMVAVTRNGTAAISTVEDLAAGVVTGNVYIGAASAFVGTAWVAARYSARVAHGANAVRVTMSAAAIATVCVSVYQHVASVVTPAVSNQASGATSLGITVTGAAEGSTMWAAFSQPTTNIATIGANGQLLSNQTASSVNTIAICGNWTINVSGNLVCNMTFSLSAGIAAVAFELLQEPGTAPALLPSPKIMQYKHIVYTVGTPITTPVTLCSTTDCPSGLYRLSFYANAGDVCSGGNVAMTLHFQDLVPGPKAHSLFSLTSTANNFVGQPNFTFKHAGTVPITYSYTSTACSSGTGNGTIYLILELMQPIPTGP